MAGDPVWRAAGQLRTAIAARLSRKHADLLAIPEVDPTGQRIDWYAPFEGEARKLGDLSEAERAPILDEVHRLHGEIAGLADSMEAPQRSSAERNFARLLRHALTAPGEDALYIVDGKPVMTFWGFSADAALPGVFLASPPVAPRPAVGGRTISEAVLASAPAVVATGTRSVWWQWLLLGVLLMLLLAVLAWLVRPYLPHIEPSLEAEARDRALSLAVRQPLDLQQTRVGTLQQDNENLRLELARLTDELSTPRRRLRGRRHRTRRHDRGHSEWPADRTRRRTRHAARLRRCQRGRQGRGQGYGQGPGQRPRRQECRQGRVKGPIPRTRTTTRTTTRTRTPAKDEPKPMVVPPEAKQKQDFGFLKGDWRSRTGLATATGERDIRPSYTLDDKGKGKVLVRAEERHDLRGAGRSALGRRQARDRGKGQSQVRRRSHLCPQYGQLRGRRRRRCHMQRQPARRHTQLSRADWPLTPYT